MAKGMLIRMKTIARLMALAAVVCLSVQPAGAETITSKTFAYFSVGGRTAAELDEELSKRGPMMKHSGSRHPGATKIKWGGSVTYVRRGDRCAVGEAKVTLSTQIILPRWKNRKRATASLALIWDTLASDIKRHEERHAEIARTHARTLQRTLKTLRPEADCERMQARVDRVTADAVSKHDADQARFDRVESKNFNDRMMRLLTHRLKSRLQ
jgi:predicted secreted Zn-dependent protease